VAVNDIEGALQEMDALGATLRTKRTLYHMSINPEPGKDRAMTPAEWDFAEQAALKKMGLENQPYISVQHRKIGEDGILREHRHIVAARADPEHDRAIRCDHNYRKHEEVARDLERHFGHEKVQGAHVDRNGEPRPDRTPSHAEMQQAKRGAVSRDEAKTLITGLWRTTDSSTAMQAALDAHGWMLAHGDKTNAKGRAYLMVIDPQGIGVFQLARCVDRVKAADVHARMADLDPASLPSVKEAQAQQQVREAAREARHAHDLAAARAMHEAQQAAKGRTDDTRPDGPVNRPEPEDMRPLGKTAGEIRAAWTLSSSAAQLEEALAARGITLARVSPEEAEQSQRTAAFAKEIGNFARVLKEGEIVAVNAHGDVHRLDRRTTGDTAPEIEARFPGIDRAGLLSVTDAKEVMQEAARAAWRDERQAEREKARPATGIETAIVEALINTMTGTEFAAALDKAGITITRA